jgi:hypothetical protein
MHLLGEVEEDEERGGEAEHEDHQVRVFCRGEAAKGEMQLKESPSGQK